MSHRNPALFSADNNLPQSKLGRTQMQTTFPTTSVPSSGGEDERMKIKLGVAMTSTFQCGLVLLLMGLFRMGFLTNYMPSAFVGGFTSAAALHIAVSQVS